MADAADLLARLTAALQRNQRAETVRLVRALIAAAAPLGARWKALAAVAQRNGEVDDALAAMAAYVATSGNQSAARFDQAAMLAQVGRLDAARAELADLEPALGHLGAYHYSVGTAATDAGDVDAAQDHLRRAVAMLPRAGQAWLALAMASGLTAGDVAAMDAVTTAPDVPPLDAAAADYALGIWYDSQHCHDDAFSHFARGAARMQLLRPYDPAADMDAARQSLVGTWPAAERPGAQTSGPNPIFVTGLPRSGTTLVAQILASHSAVGGADELGLMRIVMQDVGVGPAALAIYCDGGGTLADLGALYRHLLAQRASPGRYHVDKSLDSSRWMGAISTILPHAPIIWIRRDPAACAWSAFRTWFATGVPWSWSLADIAVRFRVEDALFHHWQANPAANILVVDYDRLVTDPEPEIRRILAHCNLAFEPAVLAPEQAITPVHTASVMQVRQAINTGAMRLAPGYAAHLKPFVDAYTAQPPLTLTRG